MTTSKKNKIIMRLASFQCYNFVSDNNEQILKCLANSNAKSDSCWPW